MTAWHAVAKTQDIPTGAGRTFAVNGKLIAIFDLGGEFSAMDDLCPHMGASLGEGYLEDGAVTCPWHAWRFCVKEGTWLDSPKSPLRVRTYPVRVEGADILIELEDEETAAM
ncbi:MAG: non-heme iron oxygenase ferredoxin subunit [Planctomycetaceae bacterium]|nr:non-heme iron oxygenase ferredoxin subunit [Planctomycetaceae bacterium]